MKEKGLKFAKKLFRRKKFTATIRLLEPQIFRYRDDFEFYYILGVSCLHTGDFGGSYSYLKRAAQLDESDLNVLLGLAAIHLKKYEFEDALRLWLLILDSDANNTIAKRGLNVVKKYTSEADLQSFIESGKLKKLFPKTPFNFVPWLKGLAVISAVATVLWLILFFVNQPILTAPGTVRPAIAILQGTSITNSEITENGNNSYALSAEELEETLQHINQYLLEYRDTEARFYINKVLLSNINETVKEKMRLLLPYLKTPDFGSFQNIFTYTEVKTEPALYEGCYVIWKGRVTNVNQSESAITLDFLVGYENREVLDGIVPVSINFPTSIEPTSAYEILGKIVLNNGNLMLNAASIHWLGSD